MAPKTLANFLDRKTQLYEQGATVRRIGLCVRNLWRWVRAGVEISQVSQLFVNTVQTHNKVSSHPIGVTSNHVVSSTGDTLLWAWNIRTSRKPSASWCRGAWLWHAECAEFLEKGTGPLAICSSCWQVRVITICKREFHISSCACDA